MNSDTANKSSREKMIEINAVQKDYYESKFSAKSVKDEAANEATKSWTRMRQTMMSLGRDVGLADYIFPMHQKWLGDISQSKVLDFGCFAGNELSLWIAENAGNYLGIDLSDGAIGELNAKLKTAGLSPDKAKAERCDILSNTFDDNMFDIIYAQGVLHHFMDMDEILNELSRILKPGGMIITIDPMMTEPVNRIMRYFYRPIQTNKQWEWPFTRKTFRLIESYFEIDQLQGHFGMVKLGFPLMMVPGLRGIGKKISEFGFSFDNKYARKFNIPFYLCWKVTMRLRKPTVS